MGRQLRELPWIAKRSNGIWYVHWYDNRARQTRRCSLKTKDLADAYHTFERYLAKWRVKPAEKPRGMNVTHVTVTKILDFYIAQRIDRECIDVKRPRSARPYIEMFFKDTPLNRIRLQARPALGRRSTFIGSDGSSRRELLILRTAARYALKHELICGSDMPLIEAPPEPPSRTVYLTKPEYKLAHDKAEGELKDFITLAYHTGARRSAIENLTAGQVDFDSGHIHLQSDNASAKQRRSKKRKPITPIARSLIPVLTRLTTGRLPNDRLLPKKDFYSPFNRHLKRLGLAGKDFPHILRHTRATHLLQAGASIYDVAKLLGDTTATVERVYGHHSCESLGKKLDQFDDA